VLVFWHEYNLAMFVAARERRGDLPHASFTTATARGTVIQTIFESLAQRPGQIVVLPLPDEADRAAGRALARRLGDLGAGGSSLVVTPDGPWGPYRVAKPGVLLLARHSGLPIVPVAVSARPALRLTRRWDRQLLPLPFSRLRVIAAEPIRLPESGPLRPHLADVQAALDRVTAAAERRLP